MIRLELPAVGRRRMAFVLITCSLATTLFLYAAAFGPWASLSRQIVVAGVVGPWGIGWVTLLLMERKILRDHARVARNRPVLHGEVISR